MNNQNFSNRYRSLAVQERQRAINHYRLANGFLSLFHQPWKMVFPALVIVVALFAWVHRTDAPLPGSNPAPELVWLWHTSLAAIIIILAVIILLGVLALLGRPRHAKKVDMALLRIGLTDRYGIGPALLSSRPVKSSTVKKMVFYSKGISSMTWEEQRQSIEDVLNLTFVEPPHYGGRHNNHRNYIVLTVANGVLEGRQEPLYDDD